MTAVRPIAAVAVLAAVLVVVATAVASVSGAAVPPGRAGIGECSSGTLLIAPTHWSPGCVGGSPRLEGLAWSEWGQPVARASGTLLMNDCNPYCAEGTIHRYPVAVTVDRRAKCRTQPARRQYRHFVASYTLPPDNPFVPGGGPRQDVWDLDSAECSARMPTFEQGEGLLLAVRPGRIDARRNISPGSISGLDTWTIRRWRSFGGRRAIAIATYWWHTPDGSGFRRYPARVTLHRIRRCNWTYAYTRIRGRFLERKPPGMPRTIAMLAPRYDCD